MKYLSLTAAAIVLFATSATAAEEPLATVNNKAITAQDVQNELSGVPEKLISGRQDEIQRAIVERLIQKRLVMAEAEELGIEEDETYQAQLATLRDNLIVHCVLSRKIEQEVTSKNLRQYYADNKDRFTSPAVEVAHILLPTKQEAEKIIERLNNGEDFAALAQAVSTGPSATRGGDLGWVMPGEMVTSFEDAAFDMSAGDISQTPVKTQFGWHVIKVKDKDESRTPSFLAMEEMLQKELSEKVVADYLESLQEKAEIKYEAN